MPGRSRTTRQPGPWRRDLPPPRGNLLGLIHGASSERAVEAVANLVGVEALAQAPWLAEPVFGGALHRYARAEARARLLDQYIRKVAAEQGPDKVPQRLWESASANDRTASMLAEALGLTPSSYAALAALTISAEAGEARLAQLRAEGRKLVEARAADVPGAPPVSRQGSKDAAQPERPGEGTTGANPGTEAAS